MHKPLSGGAVLLLCIFIGIVFGEVAWGIIGGLLLGAIVSSRKPKAPEDAADA